MAKLNIDNLIQDKLKDLNCEYQPEYWEGMATKIESSTLGAGATSIAALSFFSSKAFIISATTITILIGSIALYLGFNTTSNQANIDNKIDTEILNNDNKAISETSNTKIVASDISNNSIDINKTDISNADVSNTNISNTDNTSNIHNATNLKKANKHIGNNITVITNSNTNSISNTEQYNNKRYKDRLDNSILLKSTILEITNTDNNNIFDNDCIDIDINKQDVVLISDSLLLSNEEDDNVNIISNKNSNIIDTDKNDDNTIDSAAVETKEKIDKSKVKNIKPMKKPSGKIFRRKGGLFKWLGGN